MRRVSKADPADLEAWFFDAEATDSGLLGWGHGPEGLVFLRGADTARACSSQLGAAPLPKAVGRPSHEKRRRTLPDARPVEWGARISSRGESIGTLGCLALRGGERFLLSNAHVLAPHGGPAPRARILQPPASVMTVRDTIAFVEEVIPVHTTETCPLRAQRNFVDAAIARVRPPTLREPLGYVAGAYPAGSPLTLTSWRPTKKIRVGDRVAKLGGMTGLTYGAITLTNASVKVPFGMGLAMFRGQLLTTLLGEPGDSGSLVVCPTSGAAVGLLFGNLTTDEGLRLSIVNPIETVQRLLRVKVAPRREA